LQNDNHRTNTRQIYYKTILWQIVNVTYDSKAGNWVITNKAGMWYAPIIVDREIKNFSNTIMGAYHPGKAEEWLLFYLIDYFIYN